MGSLRNNSLFYDALYAIKRTAGGGIWQPEKSAQFVDFWNCLHLLVLCECDSVLEALSALWNLRIHVPWSLQNGSKGIFGLLYFHHCICRGVLRPIQRTGTKLYRKRIKIKRLKLNVTFSLLNWDLSVYLPYLIQDQWSKITQIAVHQRNWWIHSGHRFIGSFDVPWS